MSYGLKTTTYKNLETGEVKEYSERFDLQFNEKGYLFWTKANGSRNFDNFSYPEEFTWSEKGRMSELAGYILQENQFLAYRSGNTLKPITRHELCRIWDISDRQCRSLVNKMKKHNIIKEVSFMDTVYFSFNPIYALKGNRLSLTVYLFFQDELSKILDQWVINRFACMAQEIGPVFKIIK